MSAPSFARDVQAATSALVSSNHLICPFLPSYRPHPPSPPLPISEGGQTPCEEGYYSNSEQPCQICDKGFMCLGASDRRACAPGSSQPLEGQPGCQSCTAGKYQNEEAQENCKDCTVGHFCPPFSSAPISCLAGSTYRVETGAEFCNPCSNCPLGEIMTADCTITSDRQCSPCVAPAYSDDGLTCKQCSGEGQYNDEDGAAFCKTAKAGYKPTSDRKVRMNLNKTGTGT